MLDEDVSQSAGYWNPAPARSALGLDEDTFLWIPGSLDVDDAGRKVNILPTQGHDLAPSKACEEGERPESSVAFGKSSEEVGKMPRSLIRAIER